eukprot:gene22561-1342_t
MPSQCELFDVSSPRCARLIKFAAANQDLGQSQWLSAHGADDMQAIDEFMKNMQTIAEADSSTIHFANARFYKKVEQREYSAALDVDLDQIHEINPASSPCTQSLFNSLGFAPCEYTDDWDIY